MRVSGEQQPSPPPPGLWDPQSRPPRPSSCPPLACGSGLRGRAALPEPPCGFSTARSHRRARGPKAARPQKPSPLAASRTLLPEQRRHALIGGGV